METSQVRKRQNEMLNKWAAGHHQRETVVGRKKKEQFAKLFRLQLTNKQNLCGHLKTGQRVIRG